jgi:hypothetical protein
MEPQNCWEFWNCPKKIRDNCPAYTTNSGRDCYDLAEDYCPKVTNQFKHCQECPWFKKI